MFQTGDRSGRMLDFLRDNLANLTWLVAIIAVALLAAASLRWYLRRSGEDHDDLLLVIDRAQRAFIVVVVVAAVRITMLRVDDDAAPFVNLVQHLTEIVFIVSIVWLIIEALLAAEVVVLNRFAPVSRLGQVDTRKARTQIILIRRLIVAVVITVGIGAGLMTFPAVRVVGQGVLASAGLISIVAGLAAQSTLTNVFAGIQLTVTNSLRVGDVVSVAGESGTVGEITLNYVVLNLWDDRRLILPASFFTNNPYENWTRRGGRINGVIEIDVDWSVDVDAVRAEFERVLHEAPTWDGRQGTLTVFALIEGRVRLRIMVSAATTDDMFALNSHIREGMVRYIGAQGQAWVPRLRYEPLDGGLPAGDATT